VNSQNRVILVVKFALLQLEQKLLFVLHIHKKFLETRDVVFVNSLLSYKKDSNSVTELWNCMLKRFNRED
jgi:hypothetical protein